MSSDESEGITDTVSSLKNDAIRWMQDEKALAQVEIAEKTKQAGVNIALLIGAVIAVYTGIILLLLAASIGAGALIQLTGLNGYASYTIGMMSVGFLVLGGAAATINHAKQKLSTKELMPSKTVESLKNIKLWVTNILS